MMSDSVRDLLVRGIAAAHPAATPEPGVTGARNRCRKTL
jgi:hypothetical protein